MSVELFQLFSNDTKFSAAMDRCRVIKLSVRVVVARRHNEKTKKTKNFARDFPELDPKK